MRWVEREELSTLATVKDLSLLISMMEDHEKSEFQYVVEADGRWNAVLK